MNDAAVAGFLAGCLTLLAQAASPTSPPNQTSDTERIESGELHAGDSNAIAYRIRLLPLASFPDLPAPVAAELSRRQCMIPQSFEAKQPENVIHGAFRSPSSSDWAALCSAAGSTTLFVFFAGEFDSPVSLRSQPDSAWLGREPGSSVFGSSWGIAVRSLSEIRSSPQLRHAAPVDHDAIDDARLERSATIHYYNAGRWLILHSGDAGDQGVSP
jgi:hypothetical protein